MARELNIRITANNADAVTKLGQTEQAITGVTTSTTKANKGIEGFAGMLGMAKKAIGVLGVGVSIFEFMSLSSAIQDSADKLGVGVEAIQRWKFAAEQTGGSLEGLTSAATMLYRNLAGGEKGVVAALEELGFSLEQVRAMRPEQAFEAIADRVGAIPDPMKRVALGATLMGRGFADNLPAMRQGLKTLGDQAQELGLVMDATAIKAGDEFGDTLDQLKGSFMALIGTALKPILPILNELLQAALPIVKVLAELLNLVLTPLAWVLQKVAEGIRFLVDQVTALIKPTQWVKSAWDTLVEAFKLAHDIIVGTAKAIYEGVHYWLVTRFSDTVKGVKGLVGAVNDFYFNLWKNVVGRSYVPDMVNAIAFHFGRLKQVMVVPAQQATQSTAEFFAQLGQIGSQAFGQMMRNIGQTVAGLEQLKKATTLASQAVSSLTAAWAAYAVAVQVADWLNDLRQVTTETRRIRELTAAIHALGAAQTFLEMQPGLGRRYDVIKILELQLKLLQQAQFPWEEMQEAAERYGLTVEQLGRQFSEAQFLAPLRQMVTDWRLLTEHGADATAVAMGMRTQLQEAVRTALQFGYALPEGLRAAIQRLVEMGELVDENGNALTDLSRLTWTQTIEQSLQSLVEEFKKLVEILGTAIPRAASAAARSINQLPGLPRGGGGGSGGGGAVGRPGTGWSDTELAVPGAAMAMVGAGFGSPTIVFNNPQFNDRASMHALTARIEATMTARMTQRGTRFA